MNKFLYILLCTLPLLLASCGDEHLVDKNYSKLSQYVYVAPDGFNGEVSKYYEPIEELYVEQGQSVKFFAGYSNGHGVFTDETLQRYYNGLLWKIGDNAFNLNSFRYTFNTSGEFDCSLETTDLFGDTLRNNFKVYVNAPNSISLDFPYNGYNQAEPSDDQNLPLRWSVTGIDPWESARCQVFISYDQDSVWESPLGTTDCKSEATLRGSLVESYDSLLQQAISLYDSSFTLYWGIKMRVRSESGREYRDSTDIFHFSTKILNKTSTLKIPVVYERYRDNSILQTVVYLIANNGDTLQTITNSDRSNTLVAKVEPQIGLKVLLTENYRKEYTSESLIVDIPAYTELTLDTIVLKDVIPPQISAYRDSIRFSDNIYFFLYDDGSGINVNQLKVLVDFDTMQVNYQAPYLSFYTRCPNKCKIEISGEDYARNRLPNVYWFIENKYTYQYISGPFPNEEF